MELRIGKTAVADFSDGKKNAKPSWNRLVYFGIAIGLGYQAIHYSMIHVAQEAAGCTKAEYQNYSVEK